MDKNITTAEAVAAWEANDAVWSVEMGGIGPGYEQCIQLMAFSFLRWMDANPPESWEDLKEDKWRIYTDQCDAACQTILSDLGPSGAQHGAAMNIAVIFARKGYAAGLASAPADRHILVRKNFPAITP